MLLDKFNLESGHVEDDRRIVLKYILRKLDYEDEKWMAQIYVHDGASCIEYMLFISRGRLISKNSVVSCPRSLSVIINSNFLYKNTVPGDKTSFEYRNIAGKIDELKDMVV
jgi:hypothetical protein